MHTSPTNPRPMFPAPKWTALLWECSLLFPDCCIFMEVCDDIIVCGGLTCFQKRYGMFDVVRLMDVF